jgi:hypothetical protein
MSNSNIGIYFDFRYFDIIYNHYLAQNTELNIEKFFNFVEYEVSTHLKIPMSNCKVNYNEVHFYIAGTANTAGERRLEEALVKARLGNNIHRLPLILINGIGKEKGVDARLMLDAYKSARADKFHVLVLITGDADFVPLVEDVKNELNKPVFLFFWDEKSTNTATAQFLIDTVTQPFAMHELLHSRVTKNPFVKELLNQPKNLPRQPLVTKPESRTNVMIPTEGLESLLIETAHECEKDANGWILGANFGLVLKTVKKYDPQQHGKRLFNLFQDYQDVFEVRLEPPLAVRLCNQIKSDPENSSPVQAITEVPISVPRQLMPHEKTMDYESVILMVDMDRDFGFIKSPWRFNNEKMNNFTFSPSCVQNMCDKEVNKWAKVRFNLADDSFRSLKFGVPLYKAVNIMVLD